MYICRSMGRVYIAALFSSRRLLNKPCSRFAQLAYVNRADWLAGKANSHKWLASRKIWSVSWGVWQWDATCEHKAKDQSHHRSPWRERGVAKIRSCQTIFLERTREGHPGVGQTGTLEPFQRQRWGNFWQTGGAHMGFSERIDTTLNWIEQRP